MDSPDRNLKEGILRPFGVIVEHQLLKEQSKLGEHCCYAHRLTAKVETTVLLGSDSVFGTPRRYGPRAIEGLSLGAEQRGALLVESLTVADDRPLVRVEVAA